MNQIRAERGNRGGLQRSAVAVTAIGLMKHAQGLHHFAGKEFPPAYQEQSRVFRLVGDLRDRAAARPDVAVMPVEDEDLAKSEVVPRKCAVCAGHWVNWIMGNSNPPVRAATCSAIPEMMMESDPRGLWGPWNSRLPSGRIARKWLSTTSASSKPAVSSNRFGFKERSSPGASR